MGTGRSEKSRTVRSWLAVSLWLLCGASSALARDMHGRLGLGYNGQYASSLSPAGTSAISLKYGLTKDVALAAVIGIQTTATANSVTAFKFFKNIFYETNLNFYFMAGAGLVTGQPAGAASGTAGAEFLGGFGTEFFFPGLESLGFSMEVGASFHNLYGGFILKTIGFSFLNAGIHFYF